MRYKLFLNKNLILISIIFCSGCYPNILYRFPRDMEIVTLDPTANLAAIKSFHVTKRINDHKGVNLLIANKLKENGYHVNTGVNVSDNIDTVITYDDRWKKIHGIGDYIYLIRIVIREPKTAFPLASGKYYYDATFINKSAKEMVDKTITNIFNQRNREK